MAAPLRIVALNVGSQTIGLAEFRAGANGALILQDYRFRDVLAEGSGEAARNEQISAALRQMLAELRLRSSDVNYAIPAQSVFARFVKLPSVDEEKIERIVSFEAQQNVPFPIEEVVWDYQLVGAGASEQVEVVLVAVKADLLDALNAAVEETGLRTCLVDVATMALYNAFRYSYSDLKACSLVLDIGARTTNVLFIDGAKVFSRSIAIGGSSITSAIAREFNEAMATAELRKKADGFVSLGGAYAEPANADVARVSKIVRSTMTRLHAEITRSVSHYRAQQSGSAPQRVFLCGGTASMPYMREFFQEKLQLPIEFFNPLRNVTVASALDVAQVSKAAHLFGELVGLSLRKISTCPMELNLRPAAVVRRHQLQQRRPFLVAAAVCFLLGLLAWSAYFARAAHLESEAHDQLLERVSAMKGVETRMQRLRKETTALDAVAGPLIAAVNDRSFWPELLEDLNSRLPPEDIWITELIPMSAGKPIAMADTPASTTIATATPTPAAAPAKAAAPKTPMIDGIFVRGLYLSNPKQQEVVVDYFRNLVGSRFFVIDPNNQSRVLKPTMPTNTDWAFPYEIRLDLKKPISLP